MIAWCGESRLGWAYFGRCDQGAGVDESGCYREIVRELEALEHFDIVARTPIGAIVQATEQCRRPR